MLSKHRLCITLLLNTLLYATACLATPSAEQIQKTSAQLDFEAAEKAIERKNWDEYTRLNQSLADYPLQTYLQRDLLLESIDLEHTAQIESFLDEHGDQPVSKKLRFKWLHWLARNNHSSLFLRHYRNFGNSQLACKQLEFRLKTTESKQDIYLKTEQIWLTAHNLPKACDPLLKSWAKAGLLTEPLIWQRIMLAADAKKLTLVQQIADQFPKVKPAAELLINVYKHPEQLSKINFRQPLTSKAKDIVEIGINRLAWQDPNAAIQIWENLGQKYQLNDGFSRLKRSISLSLAIAKDPKASNWLNSLSPNEDSSVNQWLLSTAIHNQDWVQIAHLANQFAQTNQESEKWQYWQAIAETQLGNLTKAQALFESLAGKRQYYGFLAARQLNKSPELSQQTLIFSEDELNVIADLPAAKRAKEFYHLGRLTDARREWNYLARNISFENQSKLALISHQWGWQHQAILDFARSKYIDDVEKRFPLQHFQMYSEQSKQHNIPVSWAYAITRQESAFNSDAISSAGARGLMQLKPSTAKDVAQKTGQNSHSIQLLDADTNIKLGTAHLSAMLEAFQAHPVLATAAYNAGQSRVQQWLERTETQDAFQWIEQIPYKETRDYVKNVLTYQLIYARLTNQSDNFIAQIANLPISNTHNMTTSR